MPAAPASRRRNFNTRGRTSTTPRRRPTGEAGSYSEPPQKKRRYVPGGPGGGGRYVDAEGNETPVGGTGPGGYNYTGPRGRIGPMNAANGVQAPVMERRERSARSRRESRREKPPATRPRYSSAAAAAAAVVQGDGFKPREERGWEEFHEHLDIDAKLPVFPSGVIDGTIKPDTPTTPQANGFNIEGAGAEDQETGQMNGINGDVHTPQDATTPNQSYKRRPGRPPRHTSAMLKGIGTPDTPKVVPLPGPNPREKLTLPKPSFRLVDPFASYEKANGSIDYVDRTMANVGYQESDHFIRPEKGLIRLSDTGFDEELDAVPSKDAGESSSGIGATSVPRVEYDMDEQDQKWLEAYNVLRKEEQTEAIKPAIFEITMTKIEKEWHALEKRIPKPNPKPPQTHRPRSSSAAAVNGEPSGQGEEQDSKCAICDDGDCENTNAIVFCDGCDLAVHQECYGVPFIPEGQWLCRKCHLTGRGTPTCVFCPNTDGAFKQTNSARWSHLLCAIWIPEVSLGNTTFMEPVMDVEKVPKNRWKLVCEICNQKMGACIQCGHKSCFKAFHVTCGRRARWYLSMKSTQGGPANLETSVLKAYCGQHVPPDWRKTYNVDRATSAAKKFYKRTMRGKVWADSQQAAASLAAAQPIEPPASAPAGDESTPKLTLTLGGNKRKKAGGKPVNTVWRLPSGAPVVPAALYNSVESSLTRFAVRKRKEFAADMCRYWTLKREAKRGAALIKRLQLQMETFSSMEITRRDFAAMGAIGSVRLKRRIEFAKSRIEEVDKLLELCTSVKEREAKKLQDAELLKSIVDTVYFPIPPLLWPILERALQLDSKGTFSNGLQKIREKLEKRAYASVAPFSADFGSAFAEVVGLSSVTDTSQVESQIMGDRNAKKELSSDDKDKRKQAKRIVKAVQQALEEANHKESELCRRPYEEELLDFEQLLERSLSSRRVSNASLVLRPSTRDAEAVPSIEAANGPLTNGTADLHGVDAMDTTPDGGIAAPGIGAEQAKQLDLNISADVTSLADGHSAATTGATATNGALNQLTPASMTAALAPSGLDDPSTALKPLPLPSDHQAPTPPPSTNSASTSQAQPNGAIAPTSAPLAPKPRPLPETPLSLGGVPWYLEAFDPHGTTVYEERWTGRDVARGMSEDLTDLSEAEVDGLVDGDVEMEMEVDGEEAGDEEEGGEKKEEKGKAKEVQRTKSGKVKKRWKGFR